jgi:transposase
MARPLTIAEHCTPAELDALARGEKTGRVRDRIRLVAALSRGETVERAAAAVGLSARRARGWLSRYNAEGVQGLRDRPHPGRPRELSQEDEEKLRRFVEKGPPPGRSRVTGPMVRDFVLAELGVALSLPAAYVALHRAGFSLQRPAARHEKNDEEAMRAWKDKAPLSSRASAKSAPKAGSSSGSRTKRGSARRGR